MRKGLLFLILLSSMNLNAGVKKYLHNLKGATESKALDVAEEIVIDFIIDSIEDLIDEDVEDIELEAKKLHKEINKSRVLGPIYRFLINKAAPASVKALKSLIRLSYKQLRFTGKITYKAAVAIISPINEFYRIPEDISIKRGLLNNVGKTIVLSGKIILVIISLLIAANADDEEDFERDYDWED